MKSIFKNRLLLLLAVILAMSFEGTAQLDQKSRTDSETRRDGSCRSVIAEKLYGLRKVGSRGPKSLSFPIDQKWNSQALGDFMKDVQVSEFFAYRFKGPRETALIVLTTRVGRPLSEDSIQDWFIQVGKSTVRFKSIATNPNLTFWDNEGRLNYLAMTYSDGASMDSSSNLVPLDFKLLQILDNGVTKLIEEEKNVRCVLSMAKPR